jgi:hypothetical protein
MRFAVSTLALLTLAAFDAGPAAAQGKAFEGTVTFVSHSARDSTTLLYSIKGKRVRMDPQDARQEMFMVMDVDSKTMTMVMPGENMYMVFDIPDAEGDAAAPEVQPVNTGRTDVVAGRKCEIWTMKERGDEFEMCVARDMGTFMSGGGPMSRSASPAWQRELRRGGFFPLRVIEKGKPGNGAVLLATKIEQKSLDAGMFEPPAGAKKMSMPPGMERRP